MPSASDLSNAENHTGGTYDLTMRIEAPTSIAREDSVLSALRTVADIRECSYVVSRKPFDFQPCGCNLGALNSHGALHGVVRVPRLGDTICHIGVIRYEGGGTWLRLGLPLGALIRLAPQIGGFPFGDDGGPASLDWRRPIDEWLVESALAIRHSARIDRAVVGFDAPELDDYDGGLPRAAFGVLTFSGNDYSFEPSTM